MYNYEEMDQRLVVFGYLFRVANRLQSKLNAQMRDLTAKQWFVLLALGSFEQPPTLTQLAAACDTSHQNTKQLVLKLAEKGFVTIHHDEQDGRAMRIAASDKCGAWERENQPMAAQFVDAMFAGMGMEEVAELSSSLMRVFENLDKIHGGTAGV